MGGVSDFTNDFYYASNPFLGENDFDSFFGLVSLNVADNGRNVEEYVGKGKGVAEDRDLGKNVVETVEEEELVKVEDKDGKDDGDDNDELVDEDGNDSDELVDDDNPVEHVYVDMDNFDKTITDTMNADERQAELNANEEIEVEIDVIDNEKFESASDEDGVDV